MIGKTFLGNNVNPHMVMMSPDGRYVVTGGTRANKAYIIDTRTLQLVKVDSDRHRAGASGVLAGQPVVLPGQSGRRLDLGHRHAVADQDQDDSRIRRAAERDVPARRLEGVHRQLRRALGRRHRRPAARAAEEDPGRGRARRGEARSRTKYLGEIKGINIAAPSNDGRYLYAADSDLAVVGVIDTREDKVIKTIRVGADPWRIYMSHDGKYGITANNGDETISIIDTRTNSVAATLEAGPDMTGINFAAGKAFVISSTSGFVYVYDMSSLKPAGRIKIGTNVQLETATTDTADEKIYLAESTNHEVVIIDARTHAIERVRECGPLPVGHAYHGQQGQLLPLEQDAGDRRQPCRLAECSTQSTGLHPAFGHSESPHAPLLLGTLVLLLCAERVHTQSVRDHTRLKGPRSTTVTEAQATELTLTVTEVSVRPIQIWVRTAGTDRRGAEDGHRRVSRPRTALVKVGQRVRAFSPESRSRMYQANVVAGRPVAGRASRVKATLMGQALETSRHYVLEIVTEDGELPVGAERSDHRDRRTNAGLRAGAGGELRARETSRPASRASCSRRCSTG